MIGWREWLSIPSLRVDRIKAKIDTGARTSAIHAYDIDRFLDGGAPHVAFLVHPLQRSRRESVACVAAVKDERFVRSSSGHKQHRYVIDVEVRLGDLTWPIELTLADRDPLGFRMLLGRQALRQRFLIDPQRSFIIDRVFADLTTVPTKKRKLR